MATCNLKLSLENVNAGRETYLAARQAQGDAAIAHCGLGVKFRVHIRVTT
ncbi:hypothetical protein HBI26_217190 [Parastagonospora nodorum]|nr:hypothetical protein HBH52_188850 [Parastagonospora nodorum]KAH4062778.1 hypothetical protein HBH50_201980 [Parastagonospora nodorum]KAH4081539.1 hypothetical protein HBH48_197630 [Parastagonospora nodorum]KAH4084464.1 hypothetical protein HBH46_212380 [Parastagonospora nodorum]KAH4286190.1 hypothetical protein HBI01_240460 [Parastagonospora nodorum]